MKSQCKMLLFFLTTIFIINISWGDVYPYDGAVNYDVKRDRIISLAEDFNTLYYYVGPDHSCPK